jgi:RNA recognition motif-containing protein
MKKNFNNKSKNEGDILIKDKDLMTIYIGNLSYNKREGEIKKIFQKFGKVTYVKIVLDSKTERSKGIAFVQMPNEKDALKAISELNGSILDERTLKVSIAIDSEGSQKVKPFKTRKHDRDDGTTEKNMKKGPKRKKIRGLDILFNNIKK